MDIIEEESRTTRNDAPEKVGILNFHFANNYGAVLVPFSLRKAVESLGYRAEIINYIGQTVQEQPSFMYFRGKYLAPLSRKYLAMEELREDAGNWQRVVVGSDQVWRMFDTGVYMLNWMSGNCTLTSYAASFGHDRYEGNIPRSQAYCLLKRFDAVSVRESSGVDVCRDDFGIEAVQVLDPTFLPDASVYEEIIDAQPHDVPSGPYVCCVFLSAASRECFRDLTLLLDIRSKYRLVDPIRNEKGDMRPVAEWLALIKNARYVLTDSFHGAVFSIIFQKQFLAVMHEGFNGNARIPSLLAGLGIDHSRIVTSMDALTMDSFSRDIDYDVVNARLEEKRRLSMVFLRKALQKQPSPKAPYVPVEPAEAFRCLALSRRDGVDDDTWNFYGKWIELSLAESTTQSERIRELERCLESLEQHEQSAGKNKTYCYLKYKWYKLLGHLSFGKRKIHYKEKSAKYRQWAKG